MDRLEKDLAGQAELIRANVLTNFGVALAKQYGVHATPTMLVFDGAGTVVYARAGQPDVGAITQAVDSALAP